MTESFDVIVVGAGPAGSVAALSAARAGAKVLLCERGPFPGSKNMYGGVIYPRILDQIIPNWSQEAPIERFVTRRQTMVMTPTQAMTVDYRTEAWGEAPYNGVTAYRADFDRWLATQAEKAGATLVCSTTVTGLVRRGDAVVGITTDRDTDEVLAPVVIAADGVNSFVAKEAGLYDNFSADHLVLGAKEVLHLGREEIERRFGVTGRHGVDIEILGATANVVGGGFCYTNLDTVAIGVICKLPSLAEAKVRPEELIYRLKKHPAIAPYLKGAELVEYNAHMIPEGGRKAMPTLGCPGLVVCGDAAHMTLAAGIWLEGVNFAMGSGLVAGRLAAQATTGATADLDVLSRYEAELKGTFVLQDHERFRHVPEIVLSERVQFDYPSLICDVVEDLFTVRNPEPKAGMIRSLRTQMKKNKVSLRHLVTDAAKAARSFK